MVNVNFASLYSGTPANKYWTSKIKLDEKGGSPSAITVDTSGNVYAVWCGWNNSKNVFFFPADLNMGNGALK